MALLPFASAPAQPTDLTTYAQFTVGTKKAILESTPTAGLIAYATTESSTDTTRVDRFYVADGSNWKESALKLNTRTSNDMGSNLTNPLSGYGEDYITNKDLYNITINGSDVEEEGSIRRNVENDPVTFEVFLRDQWNTIIYDFTTADGDLRHTPIDEQIYVWSGNSVSTGLNGLPIVQAYQVSMGAYPYPVQLTGGSF